MKIEVVGDLGQVERSEWDALAGMNNPFVEYAFLRALETSGSVGREAGWAPAHVLVRDGPLQGSRQRLVAACPLYVKGNSYGEYIFDWSWANAAHQMGVEYYPKLVVAVPFTPAAGPRLLRAADAPPAALDALLGGVATVAEEVDASSIHVLFCTEAEQQSLKEHGLLPRLTFQYHWENVGGWADFDAYLASFRASKRRQVNKERREAAAAGLTIRDLAGDEITDETARWMYRFYRDTTHRKGAIPYLTEAFFAELSGSLKHLALITVAFDDGRPVAGALRFQKGDQLFGRYWGCLEAYDKLHFELCYYRSIQLCLQRGWRRFEAGAQGQHKIKRGLMPSPTYSAHWLRDPQLASAVRDYLPREARQTRWEMQELERRGPFRRDTP